MGYTEQVSYCNFSGGLNNKTASILIADNEASDLQNVMFTETGAITKRTGYTTLITTPVVTGYPVTSIFDYQKNDGTQYLITTSSGYIKKLNGAGTNWDTLLSTMTAVTGTDFYDYCVYPASGSICIITNGKDKIQKYTGLANTLDLGTGTDPDDWRPNTAKYCETWDYRLWFANITDANGGVTDTVVPNRVRYSSALGSTAIEGAGAWPPLFYFDIADSRVTGLAKLIDSNDINDYRQKLIVFGPNSISVIGGTYSSSTNYNLKKIVDGKGTLSNRTIKTADNILIFQDKSGDVYSFDGANVKLLSEKIQTTINGLNKQYLHLACAAVYPKYHQYWLAVADGVSTTNNLVLVYDYPSGAWTKYTGINVQDFSLISQDKIIKLCSGITKQDWTSVQLYTAASGGSSSPDWRDISMSYDGSRRTAVGWLGEIFTSSDYGLTWAESFTNDASIHHLSVSVSGFSGQYQAIADYAGYIWESSDYGVTFSTRAAVRNWFDIAISSSGQFQVACVFGGKIWASLDYGETWSEKNVYGSLDLDLTSVAISASGYYSLCAVLGESLYSGGNYSNDWMRRDYIQDWRNVAMSGESTYQTAVISNGQIFRSADDGTSWSVVGSTHNWQGVSISTSGQYQVATADGVGIYTSLDYGVTWTSQEGAKSWQGVSISANGQYQSTPVQFEKIYNSANLPYSSDCVYIQDSGNNDNGLDIISYYTTKDFSISSPVQQKQFDSIYTIMTQSGVTNVLDLTSNYNLGRVIESKSITLGNKVSLNKSGNFVKFTFGVTGTTSFTLYGFTIKYFPIELR